MKQSTCGYLQHNGCWLMMLRDRKENDVNHGKWIGVGGKTEAGETPRQCMCREIREETGIVIPENHLLFRGTLLFHYADEEEKIWIYTAETADTGIADCREGTLRWIPENEIFSLELWEGDRIFLRRLLSGQDGTFSLDLFYNPQGQLIHWNERNAENE